MKTLEDCIGCWTIQSSGLAHHIWLLNRSFMAVRGKTKRGDPKKLLDELTIFRKRVDALQETLQSAIVRCEEIIEKKEI